MQIFKNPNFNFVKYRWHALVLSWLVIGAGLLTIVTQGLPMGVEFSGGTIVIVKFDATPSVQSVRDALSRHQGLTAGQNIVVQRYGDEAAREVLSACRKWARSRGPGSPRPPTPWWPR